MAWNTFDSGRSLGTVGSEGGTIRRDEEHDRGARITLEEGASAAPWSITCGIYGWMVYTRFLGSQIEGTREFDEMKAGLEAVLRGIPSNDEATSQRLSTVSAAIEAFVKRFP